MNLPVSEYDIDKALAEKSLAEFSKQAWHIVEPNRVYAHNWHIDAICEHLEAVVNGEIRNLLINMPPRHMKSLLCSVFFPAWVWGPRGIPESRWLYSSYAQSLSSRDSMKTRRIIKHPWYQERWGDVFQLQKDQDEKLKFENDSTGHRIASSVKGANTGEGGDYIVADDPHKVNETESKAERMSVVNWWDNEMSTRGNDPATYRKIVVMQRIHEMDLSGHILHQGGYEHLCLPAEYESKRKYWFQEGPKKVLREIDVQDHETSIGWRDPRTKEGELLWKDRFTRESLEELKTRLGSRGTAGQLQQRPAPAKGDIVEREWWRFFPGRPEDKLKEMEFLMLSWDCAFKGTKDTDFVVGQVWGKKGPDRFLIDQYRKQMGFVETIQAMLYMNAKWPQVNENLIEEKANGPAVIDLLKKKIPALIPYNPTSSKESRVNAVAPLIEGGNIYLPDVNVYNWVEEYIEEWTVFPNGTNDDQVDATTQALIRLSSGNQWMAFANMKDNDEVRERLIQTFWGDQIK